MTQPRITLVTLTALDVAALTGFYERLGWVAAHKLPETSFFDLKGFKFGIYNRAMMAKDLGRPDDSLRSGAMALAQNFVSKAEVDAAYKAAIAAGATVCKEPEDVFWGGYSGTWADPEGHIWEYAFNPFWDLDEDGYIA